MIEIEELTNPEITDVLQHIGYGHLACSRNGHPYVVPVHYAFSDGDIYIYTTEGKKTEIIDENPNVCLQIEQVVDEGHWLSVIVDGIAIRLARGREHERALKLVTESNPTLTPAVSIHWMDDWVRENVEAVYQITPVTTSGRRTVDRTGHTPFVPLREPLPEKLI